MSCNGEPRVQWKPLKRETNESGNRPKGSGNPMQERERLLFHFFMGFHYSSFALSIPRSLYLTESMIVEFCMSVVVFFFFLGVESVYILITADWTAGWVAGWLALLADWLAFVSWLATITRWEVYCFPVQLNFIPWYVHELFTLFYYERMSGTI